MGTTSLLIEVVIIGFQVMIWVILLVISRFGYNWIHPALLKDWSTIISFGVIGVAYTLGLIFDTFCQTALFLWERKFKSIGHDGRVSVREAATFVLMTSKDAFEYLQKLSNQTRLMRSTSANFALIGIAGLIFTLRRTSFSWPLVVIMVVGTILLTGVALGTWVIAQWRYYSYLSDSYQMLKKRQN